MEIAEQNCGLRTSDDQDNEYQNQKSEHVVCLMGPKNKANIPECYHKYHNDQTFDLPNAVQNEEQLNKDAAKGQNATHDHARKRFGIQALRWHLTRNLVCPHRMFDWLEKAK